MAADDGRHSPRYPAYSQRRARNTEAPAAIAVAVSDGDHEKTKIVDFSKTYEKWMRMTMMSTFAEPGLESTYRAYQMSVFGDRVKTWFLLVALMCTCGMIIIETGHLFTGNLAIRGNIALRLQINGAAMLYWLGFFCARSVPTSWLHAFYKRQQVILCLISITFGIAVALPGLLQPNQLSSAPLDGLDRYVQGHFGAIFGATCLMTLAWSDLSPLIYAILSLFLLVVWNLRNIRMQFAALPAAGTGANGTLPSGQAHESPSFEDMYQVTLLHYLAAWVGSIFISYQKDTLMRRNFVILQVSARPPKNLAWRHACPLLMCVYVGVHATWPSFSL